MCTIKIDTAKAAGKIKPMHGGGSFFEYSLYIHKKHLPTLYFFTFLLYIKKATGAGKTTMVNLLMRFFEINGGSITVDGIPIHDVRREDVHEMFGMVLQDTPMLILDEATSSVDTRTEVIIQRAMDELTKGRTSFVIAHRLSTIRNADIILVMKDGDVIENGDHETLMKQEGFYYQLYQSQFDVESEQEKAQMPQA